MSDVTLSIAGRRYTLACAPGEEAHLADLGQAIDRRIAAQPNLAAQSEVRRLLYAALLLADELHEKEAETASLPAAPPPAATPDDRAAEALEALAERLERTAEALEKGTPGAAGA